jgi:hypothetical protein
VSVAHLPGLLGVRVRVRVQAYSTKQYESLEASPPFAGGRDQERSAAEQLDQFSPLTVAEAADRLGVGDPAAGKRTIGPGGTDPRYDQQQLTHFRRKRAGRRVGDHPRQLDPAGGDSSLQPRARATRTSFAFASARNRCSGDRPKAVGARLTTGTTPSAPTRKAGYVFTGRKQPKTAWLGNGRGWDRTKRITRSTRLRLTATPSLRRTNAVTIR